MRFTIFSADCCGNEKICVYPDKYIITDEISLGECVKHDHVCAEYRDNYRSEDNFIISDAVPMDCDNSHSDDPAKWVSVEDFMNEFEDVHFALVTSRNHMKTKGGKAARPRFHVYFPIPPTEDVAWYKELKKHIQTQFPFFDANALGAARFLYGSDSEDVVWNEGIYGIEDFLIAVPTAEPDDVTPFIKEGSRNSTMSHFAGRILKRYGISDRAHEAFLQHAAKCAPPLDDDELNKIWASAVKFAKKVAAQPGYVPPEEYEAGFPSLKPEDMSDIGQAKVLVKEYGNELIYTAATDYLRFDGKCWVEDKQLALAAVEEFLDLQLEDAKDVLTTARDALVAAGVPLDIIIAGGAGLRAAVPDANLLTTYEQALAYMKFVVRRRDYKYVVSAANAAKPMLAKDINELDVDPGIINTPSATYELKEGLAGAREHNPLDFVTKITACAPTDEGRDLWQATLRTFFQEDEELIDYVQCTVGMAAVGEVFAEHMIIAYGDGSNGKSTFWNTVFRVLGSYAGKLSADALAANCKRNVKPEMAEMKGKRLIIASELQEGMRLNTSMVKQLCSTDEISAEKKYKDPFFFKPSHTLVLYTNHLPRVGANDDGIWRRLIVIPFNAKITGKADIKNYTEYLFEHAGGAIMSWIIEGAQKVITARFHIEPPQVVKDAIEAYRKENDWLGNFLDECCEKEKSYRVKSGDLYQAYRAHCVMCCEYTRSTTDFYGALDALGYIRQKCRDARYIIGLRLKEDL